MLFINFEHCRHISASVTLIGTLIGQSSCSFSNDCKRQTFMLGRYSYDHSNREVSWFTKIFSNTCHLVLLKRHQGMRYRKAPCIVYPILGSLKYMLQKTTWSFQLHKWVGQFLLHAWADASSIWDTWGVWGTLVRCGNWSKWAASGLSFPLNSKSQTESSIVYYIVHIVQSVLWI